MSEPRVNNEHLDLMRHSVGLDQRKRRIVIITAQTMGMCTGRLL